MSKREKESFKILPIETLPKRHFPVRQLVYDNILKELESKSKGNYKIEIPNKKSQSVYLALTKRCKNRKNLKVHFISKTVYVEKLS